MNSHTEAVQAEDLVSVGSRISWGAIVAGGLLTLAIYFLLTILGAAVGLSISDRVTTSNLKTTAVVWAVLTTCVALFVGGLVTSQFTVGENKMEAVLYGIIMWALVLAMLIAIGAAGANTNTGFNGMVGMANMAQEASARRAHADRIEEWNRQVGGDAGKTRTTDEGKDATVVDEDTKRVTWYAFLGTWLSMIAAAAGSLVGAGPTFRAVTVRQTGGRVVTTT